ncbi:MAG: plasmid pRiA4b ORF-3 family protein [Opitutaceae bacterium]|nr:plasmid pRiA4b ORF-3 family protein [Opitutaceae bacterium]MBP9913792.1 plasmid pRiA4b ORF-3 family protein [Opitutaceae bacterium]
MISLLEGVGSAKKKAPEKVFALRLEVAGTTPRIWRRLLVRETMWLSRLHDTIQIIFDWFDYQTHVFTLDELRLGNPLKHDEINIEDDRDVTLGDLDLGQRHGFVYHYNFGEGWQLDIKVEKTLTMEKGAAYPICMAGAQAGPPEDCGGLEAFHDMLACLKDPGSELGREWLEWVGPDYAPDICDLVKINKALRKLGKA